MKIDFPFQVVASQMRSFDAIRIDIFKPAPEGKLEILQGVLFTRIDQGEEFPSDGLLMSREVCQSLMDELWRVGIRPADGTGSAGAMLATENHIKDLREISGRLLSLLEERK